jgi:hypothetical protein
MGEESAGVNLVAEDESDWEEDEDEEWWVGTVGVMEVREGKEEALEEVDESEPEEETQFITSSCTRKDDSGLEDEFECPSDTHSPEEPWEDRWWSPEPLQPNSEEDEGEAQYSEQVPSLEPLGAEPIPKRTAAGSREDGTVPDKLRKEEPPHLRGAKRKRLRKKAGKTRDQEWEQARQDAWLREMLSDTSGSEDEESWGRFAESGRWISELFKIPQHPATTSGGECSG